MILNGECGQFNPLLLSCLQDIEERIDEEFKKVAERMGKVSRDEKLHDRIMETVEKE